MNNQFAEREDCKRMQAKEDTNTGQRNASKTGLIPC